MILTSVHRKVNHMDIILNNSSGMPIYEQIKEQIKSQIIKAGGYRDLPIKKKEKVTRLNVA